MNFEAGYDDQPQGRLSNIRASVGSRFSKFFTKPNHVASKSTSQSTSAACEVPVFMSPSSDHLERDIAEQRSPRLFGAVYDVQGEPQIYQHQRPITIPASSVYSESPGQQHQTRFMEQIEEEHSHVSRNDPDLEQGYSYETQATSQSQLVSTKHKTRRRVRESTKQRIAAKRRLSLAFGVTVLAAVVTYLVLAVTGTAHGLMFHVLSVLFILALAGVFLHSSIRLIMLQKRRRARQARHRLWHGSDDRSATSGITRSDSSRSDPFADPLPEKPIEIREGPEEVLTTTPRGKNKRAVKQPPPVYGNFRESQRMHPEMVYWHKQNPSPSTPTYDEAMNEVQTAVGFQPPEYISPRRERQNQPGPARTSNVHPLERERLAGLMANTMSSQR